MVGLGTGQRREHVDVLDVRAGQHVQRGHGPDAAVDVAPAADDGRLVPAGNGAGGDHGVGQRRRRGAVPAEQHALPGVVVHRRDPGRLIDPAGRPGPALQPGDQGAQRGVPAAAVRQPGAGGHPRRHPVRGEQGRAGERDRAEAHPGQRRQRAVLGGQRDRFGQQAGGLAALPGRDLLERRAAAQGRGQHAARAGPDHQVDVADRAGQPLGQAGQGAGHPGRAEHAARPEHQGRGARGAMGAARHPIRTEHHSSHGHLRNHSRRRQLSVGCAS